MRPIKLGFDRERARELQWWFTNARIEPAASEHVLDSFMGFARACGIDPAPPHWDLTLPADALEYARGIVTDERPTLVISPCSSHTARNWSAERYAAVADHAADVHGMRVVLVGGPQRHRSCGWARRFAPRRAPPSSTKSARTRCRSCSGCCPEAPCCCRRIRVPRTWRRWWRLPVIGLYAATNPARAGPYYSRQWCIDKYDAAAQKFLGRPAAQIPWTTKIERPGVMDLISVGEVTAKLDALMAALEFSLRCAHERNQGPHLSRRIARQDHHPAHQVAAHERPRQVVQRASRTARARGDVGRLGLREDRHRGRHRRIAQVNERLWVIEDDIRDKERAQAFDAEFIRLARAVYFENDERAAIKRRINAKLGSRIVEEKSYREYEGSASTGA